MLLGILSSVLVFEASVHIQFAKGLFSYQSSVATVVWNIAPLSIIHKALQATGRSVALPGWATVSQGLVALALLCALTVYLRRALRGAENVPKELPILAYSLFTVFPFVFANHIEIYHAGVLVLPYALLFLAVPLGRKQRVLLVTSFALLAFHTHIIYLSQGISGKLGSAVQVGTPGALGILIFAGTIVHRLIYHAKQVC